MHYLAAGKAVSPATYRSIEHMLVILYGSTFSRCIKAHQKTPFQHTMRWTG